MQKEKTYTVRNIPADTYRLIRIEAGRRETSINKVLVMAIKKFANKIKE